MIDAVAATVPAGIALAMSPFDLRTPPFYLLGVSPRDDRAVIEDAVEAAIADGKLSEAGALRAQQTLMAPKPRLSAEVAWLAGVAPNRARKLIDAVALGAEDAAGLPLLAGANIAGHHLKHRLPGWRAGVDTLLMEVEVDALGVEFTEEPDQVLQ